MAKALRRMLVEDWYEFSRSGGRGESAMGSDCWTVLVGGTFGVLFTLKDGTGGRGGGAFSLFVVTDDWERESCGSDVASSVG